MVQNPVLSELLQCDSAITIAVNTHEDALSVCRCHVISEHRHCIYEFADFNSSRPICIEPLKCLLGLLRFPLRRTSTHALLWRLSVLLLLRLSVLGCCCCDWRCSISDGVRSIAWVL